MKILIATVKSWNLKNVGKLIKKYKKHRFCLLSKKEQFTLDMVKEFKPDIIFVPHWNWIIPKAIYSKYKTIIFHMTDLPFGRGGSPLQNLLSRGIYTTQISAIKCVKNLDAGPVYCKEEFNLHFGSAQEILTEMSNIIFDKMIPYIIEKNPKPQPQKGKVTEFKRRKPKESNVRQLKELVQMYDWIRMLDGEGYPPAYIETPNFRIEFTDAKIKHSEVIAKCRILKKKVKEY